MSVCKHLPHGTTLIKWQIGGFDEKCATAVCGDRWCSDLFTANFEGRPQCFLQLGLPFAAIAYSKEHPHLDLVSNDDDEHLKVCFVDNSPDVSATLWVEGENGEIIVNKKHAWGFRREMLWPSLRRLTAEKVVYVCCELRKPVCGPVHRSNFEGDGGIQLVDRSVLPMEFQWDTKYSSEQQTSGVIAVPGTEQKFSLIADANMSWLPIKNEDVESEELFHYELWIENSKGERTHKTEGIEKFFAINRRILARYDNPEMNYFYRDGYALVRLNLRPLRAPRASSLQIGSGLANPMDRAAKFLAAHFNDETYTGGVQVIAKGGIVFHVIKAHLCAQSEVFQRMFGHKESKESSEGKIVMDDLEPAVVEAMLRWMYTGKVDGLKDLDAALYVAAHRYQLVGLQELCVESMATNFSADTIFDYLQLAFTYDNLPTFKQTVVDYALRNIEKIIKEERWNQFAVAHMDIVNELLLAAKR